jgi:hypothetical protein
VTGLAPEYVVNSQDETDGSTRGVIESLHDLTHDDRLGRRRQ